MLTQFLYPFAFGMMDLALSLTSLLPCPPVAYCTPLRCKQVASLFGSDWIQLFNMNDAKSPDYMLFANQVRKPPLRPSRASHCAAPMITTISGTALGLAPVITNIFTRF